MHTENIMQGELAISKEFRSPRVKTLLKEIFEILAKFHSSAKIKAYFEKNNIKIDFYSIIFPWIIEEIDPNNPYIKHKNKFKKFGFDGDKVKNELLAILEEDRHLAECCVNSLYLAKSLNIIFDPVFLDTNFQLPSEEAFENFFQRFSDFLYYQPFVALTYSHLFNFNSKLELLHFGNLYIEKLTKSDISKILGEYTQNPFLHALGSGEFFVVTETTGIIPNDVMWLFEQKAKTENFTRLFQYYKDGIIHINYTSPYYYPVWLNGIRKSGVFFAGEPRLIAYEGGAKLYTLNNKEFTQLKEWWELFQHPRIAQRFGEERNNLGKVIEVAGDYFESSHTQTEDIRRFIDLAIALEALFSPHNQGETTFQISQLAAEFMGETADERIKIFDNVKKMYRKRSSIFHGSSKIKDESFLSAEYNEEWSSFIRRALLKFITLYLRGEIKHENVIENIRLSLFDAKKRQELKKQSQFNIFLKEMKTTGISSSHLQT